MQLDTVPKVETRQVKKQHPEHPGERAKETGTYPAVLPGTFEEVKSICQKLPPPADPLGLPFL